MRWSTRDSVHQRISRRVNLILSLADVAAMLVWKDRTPSAAKNTSTAVKMLERRIGATWRKLTLDDFW